MRKKYYLNGKCKLVLMKVLNQLHLREIFMCGDNCGVSLIKGIYIVSTCMYTDNNELCFLSSDIVVQIVDARNPLLFRCKDLVCNFFTYMYMSSIIVADHVTLKFDFISFLYLGKVCY